ATVRGHVSGREGSHVRAAAGSGSKVEVFGGGTEKPQRTVKVMPTIKANFDGQVFIPCEPIQPPVGTPVEVILPSLPPQLTEEEKKQWKEVLQQIRASEPPFSTVDEALRYSRKRP